ncbi:MAG: hypothetical protein WBE68_02855, partial [Candidatus Nitrosopolaris sp.]
MNRTIIGLKVINIPCCNDSGDKFESNYYRIERNSLPSLNDAQYPFESNYYRIERNPQHLVLGL